MEKVKFKENIKKLTSSRKRIAITSLVSIALIFAILASPLFAVLPPQYWYGSITVTSNPSGATIGLVTPDGKYTGPLQNTPYTFSNVASGWSTVTLSLAGYQEWSTQIYVNGGENEYVYGTMVPAYKPIATGAIKVDSNPSGAAVELTTPAGRYGGTTQIRTPYTFTNIPVGISTIRIYTNEYGWHDWYSNVEVDSGETTYINALLTPIETKGAVYITSSPSGANIGLDGQWWGTFRTTPDTIADITPGHHVIQVSMEGYEMWSTTVEVESGETAYVQANLLPEDVHGSLSLNSDPLGASVTIRTPSGGYISDYVKTPYLFDRIETGYSNITFSKDGYESVTKRVYIKADGVTYVDATLKPILFK